MPEVDDPKDINHRKFLTRLSAEIGKCIVIDVLRKGVDHGPVHFDLFYGTPSPGNVKAEVLHSQNRFSITRQLAYSMDETRRALDLCLFINGLPIATFELKNSLTKQTVEDAVEQYRRDHTHRERLFEFGAASCTSRWTTARCKCAPSSGAKAHGSSVQQGSQRRRGKPAQPARPRLGRGTSSERCVWRGKRKQEDLRSRV
jgi:type I restriction enzyme R subunit